MDWPSFSLGPETVNLEVQKESVTGHTVTGAAMRASWSKRRWSFAAARPPLGQSDVARMDKATDAGLLAPTAIVPRLAEVLRSK